MRTFLFLMLGIAPLFAQNNGIDQPSDFVMPPTGGKFLRWHGKPGRCYFVQVSSDAEPLQKWSWAPIIETGNNQDIIHEIFSSAPRGFFRLKYTDDPIPAGKTPETSDFDGDGKTNLSEITGVPQTDPLNADTDDDGLDDGTEELLGLDPNNKTTIPGLPDLWLATHFHDILLNGGLSTIDPNADPDGDGASIAEEALAGTDPNTADPASARTWVSVTGNGAQGVPVTRTGTLTIPAGQSAILVVATASDEFSEFTGTASQWNDQLQWSATPSQGTPITTTTINVNSRHAAWTADQTNGTSITGFPSPTHIEEVRALTAPANAPLTVAVQVTATNISDNQLPSHVAVGLIPIEVVFIDPNDATWDAIVPEKKVFLKDKKLRVRVKIKGVKLTINQLKNLGFSDIYLNTSITRAGLPETPVSISDQVCTVISSNENTEIRAELALLDLQRFNLLPSGDENDYANYSTLDYANGAGSNFEDSQAFIDTMTAGGRGVPAGYANNKPNVTLASSPPQSSTDKTFFQAAGAEVISARFGSCLKLGMVMNQAELYYFSGHGFNGTRQNGPGFSMSDEGNIDGIELINYWNDDLHIAIIAGCSAVNINNLNPDPDPVTPPLTGPNAGYYPGEFMNTLGPRYILGYGSTAPSDIHGSTEIISSFTNNYLAAPLDPFSAWASANYNAHAWYATALEKNVKFGHFEAIKFLGITVDHVWTNTLFEEW